MFLEHRHSVKVLHGRFESIYFSLSRSHTWHLMGEMKKMLARREILWEILCVLDKKVIFGACYFLGGLVLTIEGVSVEISLDENGALLPCFNWKVRRLVARVIELIPCSRVCDKKHF